MSETSCTELTLNWQKLLQAFALLLTMSPLLSGYSWSRTSKGKLSDQHVALTPAFDDLSIREIQAKTGQTVLLPCTVRNLGDKVVSWIRTRDLHILTSGSHTFSADNRFESVYSIRTNFWGLRIRGIRNSDAGRYECQVNTDPKMSLGIVLKVTDFAMQKDEHPTYKWPNEAKIKGPPEVYAREGSTVTFTCEILASSPLPTAAVTQSPLLSTKTTIYWLHESKQISADSLRGGISVETDYRSGNSVSRLRLISVSSKDSGQYVCTQASAKPGNVRLVVMGDEHTEAMQRDAPSASGLRLNTSSFNMAFYFNFCIFINLYIL